MNRSQDKQKSHEALRKISKPLDEPLNLDECTPDVHLADLHDAIEKFHDKHKDLIPDKWWKCLGEAHKGVTHVRLTCKTHKDKFIEAAKAGDIGMMFNVVTVRPLCSCHKSPKQNHQKLSHMVVGKVSLANETTTKHVMNSALEARKKIDEFNKKQMDVHDEEFGNFDAKSSIVKNATACAIVQHHAVDRMWP